MIEDSTPIVGLLPGFVEAFMRACDQPVRSEPQFPPPSEETLRYKLLAEEFKEYAEAINSCGGPSEEAALASIADALADIIYVAVGTMHSYGFDVDSVMGEVCASNFTKIRPDGKVLKDKSGKVLKPDSYVAPDIESAMFGRRE